MFLEHDVRLVFAPFEAVERFVGAWALWLTRLDLTLGHVLAHGPERADALADTVAGGWRLTEDGDNLQTPRSPAFYRVSEVSDTHEICRVELNEDPSAGLFPWGLLAKRLDAKVVHAAWDVREKRYLHMRATQFPVVSQWLFLEWDDGPLRRDRSGPKFEWEPPAIGRFRKDPDRMEEEIVAMLRRTGARIAPFDSMPAKTRATWFGARSGGRSVDDFEPHLDLVARGRWRYLGRTPPSPS